MSMFFSLKKIICTAETRIRHSPSLGPGRVTHSSHQRIDNVHRWVAIISPASVVTRTSGGKTPCVAMRETSSGRKKKTKEKKNKALFTEKGEQPRRVNMPQLEAP
jgi:hypothetical protein